MLKYFFAAAISFSHFEAGTGQRVPSSQLYPTQKVILEKEAPQLTDPRDGRILEISAVTGADFLIERKREMNDFCAFSSQKLIRESTRK